MHEAGKIGPNSVQAKAMAKAAAGKIEEGKPVNDPVLEKELIGMAK